MWRHVTPAFEDADRIVLFDHVGAGGSDLEAYDRVKSGSLRGCADDVLELCRELDLRDVVFVGHSVSAMVGVLATGGRIYLETPCAPLLQLQGSVREIALELVAPTGAGGRCC